MADVLTQFATHAAQFVVSVDKEIGLVIEHAEADVRDHLSWDQVKGLLVAAFRDVRPDVLFDPTIPEDRDQAPEGTDLKDPPAAQDDPATPTEPEPVAPALPGK